MPDEIRARFESYYYKKLTPMRDLDQYPVSDIERMDKYYNLYYEVFKAGYELGFKVDEVTRLQEHLNAACAKNAELIAVIEKFEDRCPHCGATEFLCGHKGPGCTSDIAKQGESDD